jgi:hypothetical protein
VQRDEARAALVKMADEVERSYSALVDTIAPLYAIADAGSLSADFPAIRSGFKRHYLKSARAIRVHCGVVMEQLDELLAAKQWKSRLPVAQRSFRELKQLCYQWFDNDVILAEEMENLLRNLNRVLDRIERSRRTDPDDAFDQLSFFLDQTETDFLAMKESIDELAALGRTFG